MHDEVDRRIVEGLEVVHELMRAQEEGLLKPMSPVLLMELVFGAFNGMMRASWEKRIELAPEMVAAAEQACWDTVAHHGRV